MCNYDLGMKDFLTANLLIGLVVVVFVGLWIIGFLSMIGSPIADNFWDGFDTLANVIGSFVAVYLLLPSAIGAAAFWVLNKLFPSQIFEGLLTLCLIILLPAVLITAFLGGSGNPQEIGLRP